MLGSFQKTVLFSAVIVLMIALVFIGVALRYSNAKNWPPITSDCPDYWIVDGSGNNTNCINVKDLGTNNGACGASDGKKHTVMNFNNYTTEQKTDWAKGCHVSWDGITYGVDKPAI